MKRIAVVLLVSCILVNGLSAAPYLALVENTSPLTTVLEQQPLVKCLSVFSDISLQVVDKWFHLFEGKNAGNHTQKPKEKKGSNTAPGGLVLSSLMEKPHQLCRWVGREIAPSLRSSGEALDGISYVARYVRYRPDIHLHILLLLLLATILPRGGLGEYAIRPSTRISKTRSHANGAGFFLAFSFTNAQLRYRSHTIHPGGIQ